MIKHIAYIGALISYSVKLRPYFTNLKCAWMGMNTPCGNMYLRQEERAAPVAESSAQRVREKVQ